MVKIMKRQIESILSEAINSVKTYEDTQLVSITQQIDERDPLAFFETAKNNGMDRVLWTSTADDFYITGAGRAWEIAAQDSRFRVTEENWNDLLQEAIIHNPYQVAGTGLVALGGMSFDPQREQSRLWENFQSSQFTIPRFILTKNSGKYYFTWNLHVRKDDHPVQLVESCAQMKIDLLTSPVTMPRSAEVVAKKEIAAEEWKDSVRLARKEIEENKAEKIVLARELRLKLNKRAEISALVEQLIRTQPNSYVFAVEHGEDCFVGATPERLVKVQQQQLLSTCLAGTAPRGKTNEEDIRISADLLQDRKNREEHNFVVQMIKRSIENYCTDVVVPDEPVVYPLKNLQHLYTPVTATLKNTYSIFDIIAQLHPTPALGGTPTERSLCFIREHEQLDRGWYGAPIGWLDSNRNGEFAVAIRSGLIQGDEASLFAGCGVVKDSDIEAEYEETSIKFLPMLSALETAEKYAE